MRIWHLAVLLLASSLCVLAACGHGEPVAARADAGPPPLPGGFAPERSADSDLDRDCFWLWTTEQNVMNVTYPDLYAGYWLSAVVIPPGAQVRIHGQFPHARYMSFNVYSPASLRPIGGLADIDIHADAGSSNPFVAGVARDTARRDFTIHVIPQLPPQDGPEPNTLYTVLPLSGIAASVQQQLLAGLSLPTLPSNVMLMVYRVYVPDAGTNRNGGVDMPDIEIVDAAGHTISGPDVCDFLEPSLPTVLNDALATAQLGAVSLGLSVPPSLAALSQLQWFKYFDLLSTYVHHLEATPLPSVLPDLKLLDFMRTPDNEYLFGSVSQQFGELVSISALAPTHRKTVRGEESVANEQLRYFSFCSNDFYTRRAFDCVYDEQIPVHDGTYIVLVGRAADRPSNARWDCGVAWLDWGLFSESTLIYRQMTPGESPPFAQSIRQIPPPSGEQEAAVMGAYYPQSHYWSRAEFESLGCPVSASAVQP
ncbi:MAG TPA: hypothetical protein VFM56_16660 [Solimonas sp.]|jgi:hypothetical protein|nr:hypothetical protein [Solimonas sp.]